jgi:hypothetical protein
MHARRQTDDDEPRVCGAKRRYRPTVILRMLGLHGVQKRGQPRAAATVGGVGSGWKRRGNEGDTSPGTSSHVEWRAFKRAIALERRGMRYVHHLSMSCYPYGLNKPRCFHPS